jgi:hypothetical protein
MEIENKRERGEEVPGALRTAARICRGGAIPAASRRFMHQAPGPWMRVEKHSSSSFRVGDKAGGKRKEGPLRWQRGPCRPLRCFDTVLSAASAGAVQCLGTHACSRRMQELFRGWPGGMGTRQHTKETKSPAAATNALVPVEHAWQKPRDCVPWTKASYACTLLRIDAADGGRRFAAKRATTKSRRASRRPRRRQSLPAGSPKGLARRRSRVRMKVGPRAMAVCACRARTGGGCRDCRRCFSHGSGELLLSCRGRGPTLLIGAHARRGLLGRTRSRCRKVPSLRHAGGAAAAFSAATRVRFKASGGCVDGGAGTRRDDGRRDAAARTPAMPPPAQRPAFSGRRRPCGPSRCIAAASELLDVVRAFHAACEPDQARRPVRRGRPDEHVTADVCGIRRAACSSRRGVRPREAALLRCACGVRHRVRRPFPRPVLGCLKDSLRRLSCGCGNAAARQRVGSRAVLLWACAAVGATALARHEQVQRQRTSVCVCAFS